MRTLRSIAIRSALLLAAAAMAGLSLPASTTQTAAPKKSPSTKKRSATSKTSSSTHSSSGTARTGATKSSLSKSEKAVGRKSSRTKKIKGQAAPAPERISEIQDALARRGAYTGESTGKFDDSTADALRKFQASNHLSPTGKIDAPTLQKLGLGSETAGVAAPTPPPNSVANRLLSKNARPDPSDNTEQ